MKITAIDTYLVHLTNRNLPLVKITTDEGTTVSARRTHANLTKPLLRSSVTSHPGSSGAIPAIMLLYGQLLE
jgi:hypothetical protein